MINWPTKLESVKIFLKISEGQFSIQADSIRILSISWLCSFRTLINSLRISDLFIPVANCNSDMKEKLDCNNFPINIASVWTDVVALLLFSQSMDTFEKLDLDAIFPFELLGLELVKTDWNNPRGVDMRMAMNQIEIMIEMHILLLIRGISIGWTITKYLLGKEENNIT